MFKTFETLKYSFLYEVILPILLKYELHIWLRRKKSPPTPQLIKHKIIRDLAIKYSIKTLVETGTYLGVMIDANKNYFENIFTIELNKKLYKRAKKKFSSLKHISVRQGDSSKILPFILNKIQNPTVFWLDAHFSGGITSKGKSDTPIISELKMILKKKLPDCIILIDDAIEFNGKKDYPDMKEIKTIVLNNDNNFNISVKNNIIHIIPNKHS